MKEARVARGFYPVVVPIRPDKPTGRGKSESLSGKHVRWQDWSWQGWEEDRKVLDSLPTLVSASRRVKAGDVPDQLVTAQ